MKATYKKTENAFVSRVRRDSNYRRTTLGFSTDRRMTYSTALDPNQLVDNDKDIYSTIQPKINVAEIVSIQNSERLADILDPVYETIETGKINEAYDSLERSSVSSAAVIPKIGDYSKTSSIADPKDWIKCVSSPTSSLYYNSLNDYEVNYLERKFPHHFIQNNVEPDNAEQSEVSQNDEHIDNQSKRDQLKSIENINEVKKENISAEREKTLGIHVQEEGKNVPIFTSDYEELAHEYPDMLNEIMDYIESSNVILDPNVLTPNRQDGDKIVFVD